MDFVGTAVLFLTYIFAIGIAVLMGVIYAISVLRTRGVIEGTEFLYENRPNYYKAIITLCVFQILIFVGMALS